MVSPKDMPMNWDWDKLQEKRRHQGNPPQADDSGRRGSEDSGRRESKIDIEALLEQLRGVGRGGSGRGGSDPSGPAGSGAKIPSGAIKWIVFAAILIWLATGIYIVRPDEAGVVLRFGAFSRMVGSGPHYHLPSPIEEVYLPKVTQVRQTEVGFRSQYSGNQFQQGQIQSVLEEAAMLTGDENIANIQFNIQYHIKPDGAVDYLFNVMQPDAVVKKAAEAAMREVIGKTTLDAALTDGRIQIQQDVTNLLQNILDRYQVGVQVVAVQMQDVQPPMEVREAFKDVASAREDKQRLTNEAEAYRRDILPRAQGDAAAVINKAEAYKQSRILAAQGDSQRFLAVLAEYEKARDVTKQRLLYESLEEILGRPGMEKLILPSGLKGSVLPLLPLDTAVPARTVKQYGNTSESNVAPGALNNTEMQKTVPTDSARRTSPEDIYGSNNSVRQTQTRSSARGGNAR